jgi:hypothetical protein
MFLTAEKNQAEYRLAAGKRIASSPTLTHIHLLGLDPHIDRACEYVLTHQLPNGLFHRFSKTEVIPDWGLKPAAELESTPCELNVYLGALTLLGMGSDPRLTKSFDLLVAWQREYGGWVLQKHLEERFKTRTRCASLFFADIICCKKC